MTRTDPQPAGQRSGIGRRRFLAGLGVGVASALTLDTVEALAETVEGPVPTSVPDPRFSRMFQLPAFADPQSTAVQNAMMDIGKPGGLLDAKDPLSEGPVRLITNPELSPDNADQDVSNMTAGTTFVGQFLDHDVTFDNTSRLGVVTDPAQTPNTRVPRLDLDSVYGGGPSVSPQLYRVSDRATLRFGHGGLFEDLPRNPDMTAIIADPRNDENLMIAGLHAAVLLAHNPTMPVEFQTGTYRFGHSLVRPSYRANLKGDPGGDPATGAPAFFGLVFDPAAEGQADPIDLRGGARAPRRFIGWQTFFDFGGDQTQHVRPNKLIDTSISTPLFRLPLAAISSRDAPTALPQRTLLRHLTWSMPSGQRIAASTGSPVLGSDHFPELRQYGIGLDASTPLWYYVLREASVFHDGTRLGPVGGRIVAETILGLLQLDKSSYLNTRFRPSLPSKTPRTFTMTDLLRWARVDPASRGQ